MSNGLHTSPMIETPTGRQPRHEIAYSAKISAMRTAIESSASDDVVAALDAAQVGRADAHKLLVGTPCTVGINGDCYAYAIVRASSSLQTIVVADADGEEKTFRLGKWGYRSDRHWTLNIGRASEHWVRER